MGVVEAEGARLQLAHTNATVDAREVLGEQHLIVPGHIYEDDSAGHAEGGFDGVGDAANVGAVAGHETVNDDLDGVPLLLVEVELLAEVVDFAVDAHPDESGLARVLEHLFVLTLATPDHRRENLEPGALGQAEYGVHDLLDGLSLDRTSALVAVGTPYPCEQQPEIVVDLGNGAYRGARVVGDAFLIDGDGGRQALDVFHVRLVHPAQELARVGRQRLDVAALSLGVDGVERQRALAGAGDAGDDYELVARDGDVDVLEVVLARSANHDVFEGHVVRVFSGIGLGTRTASAQCPRFYHRWARVSPEIGHSLEQMFAGVVADLWYYSGSVMVTL